jgi:hypothetical protein
MARPMFQSYVGPEVFKWPEMRYCEIRKEMPSLCFEIAVCCLFEARVPKLDT